jgi:transcriptional regulator with XRE-family HTH domain
MTGDELKAWRQKMGLTQQELADRVGVHRATLVDYEKGIRRSDKKKVSVPAAVELACRGIEADKVGLAPATCDAAGGYQVMVNGRERELIDLSHDEAIMALKNAIDSFEDADELAKKLNTVLDDFRAGRKRRRRRS